MSPDPVDENVIAYRLGEVEKAVLLNNEASNHRDKQINDKLDRFLEFGSILETLKLRVTSLEKSRDRLVGAVVVVGTGTFLLLIPRLAALLQ